MTPSDVLSRVRDQLAETTAAFWTNAELYRYMADGEREVNLMVSYNIVVTAATTTTGTSGYALPSSCLSVMRLTYDGVPLRKTDRNLRDRDALDMPSYGGTLQSGSPTHFYEFTGYAYLWPTPDAAKTINYFFLKDPTEVASGTTAFTIPANYHNCLQDYVLYRAYLKDQDQGKSDWYKREFMQGVADAQRREQMRRWAGGFPSVKGDDSYYANGGLV
jgi:hypothetical protein